MARSACRVVNLVSAIALPVFMASSAPLTDAAPASGPPRAAKAGDKEIPTAKRASEAFCVLIEPKFRRARLAKPITGAKLTQLVPAREGLLELEYYSPQAFAAKKLDWKSFYQRAMKTSSRVLRSLKPHYVRNKDKQAVCAVFTSKNQLTASCVLAPEFRTTLKKELGDALHVVVPDRFTIYAFPKDSEVLSLNTAKMVEVHQRSAYPVSLELFLIDAEGIRVVGKIESR